MKRHTEFGGAFTPPAMGSRRRPIPLGGHGRLVLKEDGLEVHARQAEKYRSHILVLFAFTVTGAVFFADTRFNLGFLDGEMLGIVFCFALFGGMAFLGRSKLGKQQVVLFPWASVKEVQVVDDELNVLIKRHDPKGVLHFQPEGDPEEVADALQSRMVG